MERKEIAGIYCRLSQDDGSTGESGSIQTQKTLLTQYCQEHQIEIGGYYCDDGWSGTNFDRPDFKRMLEDIEAGKINLVLVKDLSRFGREYAQMGLYIEHYFETYPGIKKFLDDSVAHAKENGYAVTLFGRRRPVPELKSSNFMQRSFGERVAMNAPIQGTAADIIKIAMIGVDEELRKRNMKSRLILQVHDELLIEADENEVEEVKEILKDKMEHAADLSVPLIADMHTGKNWYEAK